MESHDVASNICQALGRGVTRSKQLTVSWMRRAAENGHASSYLQLAVRMYRDEPYARVVGHVGEAAEVATSAGLMDGHDVPPDVLISVVRLRKGGYNIINRLNRFRRAALEGGRYCLNDGCDVVRLLKDFKVCPQCKCARYCGDACHKQDWTTGGHKEQCGTFWTRK